jgi:hypothetical protein
MSKRLGKAKSAITAVHADTTMTPQQTLDELGELQEFIQEYIDVVKGDIRRQKEDSDDEQKIRDAREYPKDTDGGSYAGVTEEC